MNIINKFYTQNVSTTIKFVEWNGDETIYTSNYSEEIESRAESNLIA